MSAFGKISGQGHRVGWVTGHLAAWIRTAGDRLFRDEDARALRNGWQVQVRHGGLSRTYRDPRFDSLRGCPACFGTGTGQGRRPCDRCSGTGRVTLGEPLSPNAGRGR